MLLTDGESNSGQITPLDASRAAKLLGVRLYAVGAVLTNDEKPLADRGSTSRILEPATPDAVHGPDANG